MRGAHWWMVLPVAIIALGAAANGTAMWLARSARPQPVERSVWLALRDEEPRLAAARAGMASGATLSVSGDSQQAVIRLEGLDDAAGMMQLIRLDDAGQDRQMAWASGSRAVVQHRLAAGRWNLRWVGLDGSKTLEYKALIK